MPDGDHLVRGVFLLKGVVRAVAGGVGAGGDMPNWMTFLISDVPLYLIAMPVAVVLMGKSTVIETRKFNMKPGMFFKLLFMCLPMMWVGSMVGSMLSLALSDGEATNRVADLAMQTNIWNVVFLVILGPIFEDGCSASSSSTTLANTERKRRFCCPALRSDYST